jgi:diguanylate cyclase (GGDEF)-like protein
MDEAIRHQPPVRGTGDEAVSFLTRPRRFFPLSIRASLVIVMLIPLAMAVGLASSVVLSQRSTRQHAIADRYSSLTLDAILRTRIDLYDEYVPSAAIVAAREHDLSPAALDGLLGVDFQRELVTARRAINQNDAFGPKGRFASSYARLVTLRRAIDDGRASPAQVQSYFSGTSTTVDAQWRDEFDSLVDASHSSTTATTNARLLALGASFGAFTSGLGEENLEGGGSLETILTSLATPAEVKSLIEAEQQFKASIAGFPQTLGPKGTLAWKKLIDNPLSTQLSGQVQLAITDGLARTTPPYATEPSAIGGIAKAEVQWATSLTNLVLASSADLRVATVDQTNAATRTLYLTTLLMVLLILTAIGAVIILGREVRRPLTRIVAAAQSIREGELELPPLDESGPKELALAAGAFNEMSSTLRAVQAQAVALSFGRLDDPALQRALPGPTGAALQTALNKLQSSIRANELQRVALFERATRDSLTGLLNRGAALEALELDLAGWRRSLEELVVTVLFIDLDELKKINDSLGHDGGDAAICAVADALRATTRASDVVARYGGDEFLVGWLGPDDSTATAMLAQRISDEVAQSSVKGNGRSITLGCSIGVAVSKPGDRTVQELIERADHALYASKAFGRGQVRWFESV